MKNRILLSDNKFDKTGLVGYWGLNGDTLDSSGNNRNGNLITYPGGQANYVDGKKDKALQFVTSGNNSGSVVVNDNIFALPSKFSAFCWIKKGVVKQYEDILSNRNEGNSGYSWIFTCGTQYNQKLAIFSGTGAIQWVSSFVLPINVECFIGFTVNGRNLNFYANGNNVGTFSNFEKKNVSVPRFNISGFNDGTEGFSGIIDEVSYWDKELSAEEVKNLYNDGKGLFL